MIVVHALSDGGDKIRVFKFGKKSDTMTSGLILFLESFLFSVTGQLDQYGFSIFRGKKGIAVVEFGWVIDVGSCYQVGTNNGN